MAGNKINVTELRSKPKSELLDTLSDLKRELLQLRVQNINSGSSAGKATKMYVSCPFHYLPLQRGREKEYCTCGHRDFPDYPRRAQEILQRQKVGPNLLPSKGDPCNSPKAHKV